MRQPLRVRFQLDTVHCFDEADGPGDAEPYLWAVYFKIDGDTVFLDERNMLAGTATVSTRPGNHGDLGDTDVGAGDDVAIPPSIGMYDTVLKPIPLTKPFPGIEDVGGVVGCVVVMLEQDNTPDDAIAQGHAALDQAIRRELDQLIPTLGILHQSPTQMEIAAIEQRVQDAVRSAIEDAMSFLAKLLTLGNSDDVIGQSFFSVSHDDLAASGAASIPFRAWWIERAVLLLNAPTAFSGEFRPGGYDQRLDATSVTLPRGWRLILYPGPGFAGQPQIITQSGAVAIHAGSFTVDMGQVVLFDQPGFQGNQVSFGTPGLYDVAALGAVGNDRAASLRVPDGWRVTGYSEPIFRGNTETYISDTEEIRGLLAHQLSSMQIERADAGSGDGDWEVHGQAFVIPTPPPQLRNLEARFEPMPNPEGASTVTVMARDSVTGRPVAGRVLINGQDVAATNTPFTFAFHTQLQTRVVVLPPDENHRQPRRVTLKVHVWLDHVAVQASGYPDTPVPLGVTEADEE